MSIAEKLTTIAENEQKVYDAGKQAEYDRFWNTLQTNGERVNYYSAFYGRTWNDESWQPKYSMQPTTAYAMFYNNGATDIYGYLERKGLMLDFSKCTNMQMAFMDCYTTHLGVIDASSATNMSDAFLGTNKTKIDKIIVSEKTKFTGGNSAFRNCTHLTSVGFEGTLASNGVDVHWSPLDRESLLSLIDVLADKKSDTSGTTWVVTLGSTNLAKLSDSEKAIATQKGWTLV